MRISSLVYLIGCPAVCSKCTSPISCQACSSGYTLYNSFCWTPPSPSKTQATAVQAVSATTSAVGSIVSVGSSVMPIVGLVSEVVQNTRYLNLSVTDELAQIYKTFSTNMISWDLPNFLTEVEDYKPLSELFSRYDLDSSFLVNFWSTMITMGIGLCVLIACLGVQKLFFEKGKPRGLIYSLLQKVLAGSINFIIVQAYGCLDNILFYFVLDAKTNPFDGAFPRASFAFGIVFVICGTLLMLHSIVIVKKYHALKSEANAKNNMRNLEIHQKKNKYFEVFYGDFNDADAWSHCFLAFLVLRNNVSSLVLTLLYDYPLMQTVFLIILDGGILTFMLIEKPFITLRGVFFQYYFEAIALTVHICTFLLSWNDEPSEGLKKRVCTAIIYLNTAIVTGGLCFMSIDIHETVRDKINEWKLSKKKQKGSPVVLPLPDESDILSFQSSSSAVETAGPKRKVVKRNNWEDSSLQIRPEENFINEDNHFRTPQIRNTRRIPRIEFIDRKFNLP